MIANVVIGSTEYKDHVLRAGVENITSELHDEDGNLSLGSASINLSNLSGALSVIVKEVPGDVVKISSEGFALFEGKIKQGGFSYDFDKEILKLSMLDSQKFVVDSLEEMLLSDLINKKDNNTILRPTTGSVRDAANPNTFKVCDFYRLPRIIAEIFYEFNIRHGGENEVTDAEIDVPDEWAIGGGTSSLPDMSCRTFLNEVAKLINGFWWIDPTDRKFHMHPKASLVAQREAVTPVVLAVRKDTLKASDEYGIPNQINLTFNNLDQIPAREIDWRNVAKGSVGTAGFRFKRDVAIGFNAPRIVLRRQTPVVIETEGDHDNYIVELSQENIDATVRHLTAQRVLERFHEFETDATASLSLECVHSLLFDASFLSVWPPIYTHVRVPAYGERSFFVRTADVDLDEETCDLHLVGYEPH